MKKILLNGVIGYDTGFEEFMNELGQVHENEHLQITINSPGGDYFAAMDMAAAIRNSKANVTTVCETRALSAAIPIFLEGSERIMAENAVLNTHPTRFGKAMEGRTEQDFTQLAQRLNKVTETLETTIVAKTGLDQAVVKDLIAKDSWLNAKQALEMKFATKVIPIVRTNPIENCPSEILNYIEQQEKELTVPDKLDDIIAEFNIKVENETKEEAIRKFMKAKANPAPTENKKKMELPATIINMVIRSRESEIDALTKGDEPKLTVAAAKEYKEAFATKDVIVNFVNENGDIVDNYDKIIGAIKANAPVLNLQEKSGFQKVVDEKGNPVKGVGVQVMERRKAKLQQQHN